MLEAYWAYRQRFDIEHSFRFLKRNLLLDAFQTPELEHEQDWLKLVTLAYVQLWAAQPISIEVPKPWETLKERELYSRIPPEKVQQDWNRIIRLVGTPAAEVKPRGKSPGRQIGETQTPRKRHPVVKKGCIDCRSSLPTLDLNMHALVVRRWRLSKVQRKECGCDRCKLLGYKS